MERPTDRSSRMGLITSKFLFVTLTLLELYRMDPPRITVCNVVSVKREG
jgi:hypothetical protein